MLGVGVGLSRSTREKLWLHLTSWNILANFHAEMVYVLNGHILHKAGLALTICTVKHFKQILQRGGLEVPVCDMQDREKLLKSA